jgi:hypothetical protein
MCTLLALLLSIAANLSPLARIAGLTSAILLTHFFLLDA